MKRLCSPHWYLLSFLAMGIGVCHGAAASVDPAFTPSINGAVASLALQENGQIILGGMFSAINGLTRAYLARLNPDGSLDSAFPATAPGQAVVAVTISNGKVYSASADGIRRYDTNGTLDWVYPISAKALAADSNGRVWFGGQFVRIENQYHRGLARLTVGGTLDSTFSPALGCCAGDGVFTLLPAGDGMVAGGTFSTVNAADTVANLALINADGSRNSSFNGAADPAVLALVPSGDDKFVSVSQRTVARHLANGANDPTFTPLNAASSEDIFNTALVDATGKTVVGGYFNLGGMANAVRLNADGAVDTSFQVVPDGRVNATALQGDGGVLLAGSFGSVNGAPHSGVARILPETSGTAGTISLRILPLAGGLVRLSWSDPSGRCNLQSSPIGSSAWANVSLTPVTTNGETYVIEAGIGLGKAYRLVGGAAGKEIAQK